MCSKLCMKAYFVQDRCCGNDLFGCIGELTMYTKWGPQPELQLVLLEIMQRSLWAGHGSLWAGYGSLWVWTGCLYSVAPL